MIKKVRRMAHRFFLKCRFNADVSSCVPLFTDAGGPHENTLEAVPHDGGTARW